MIRYLYRFGTHPKCYIQISYWLKDGYYRPPFRYPTTYDAITVRHYIKKGEQLGRNIARHYRVEKFFDYFNGTNPIRTLGYIEND